MAQIVKTSTVFLDNKYRLSGNAYHPNFEMDPKLQLQDANNYFEFELMSADIPFSFHTLDIPNNTLPLFILCTHHSINTTVTLTMKAGNYSILTLIDALIEQYNLALQELGFSNPNQYPKLVIQYDKTTSKCTFLLPDAPNEDWTLIFGWSESDIFAEYMGFDYLTNTTLKTFVGGGVLYTNNISPNVVNVNPITSLYLRSNTFDQTIVNQECLVETNMTTSSILAQVPITFSYMTWIFFSSSGFRVRLQNKEIKDFDLYFTALTYEEIRFRGAHWRLQVRFYEMRPEAFIELDKSMLAQSRDARLQLVDAENRKRSLAEDASRRLGKIRKRLESKTLD